MGLIKAAVSSVSGNLADQWLEVLEPDNMSETTVLTSGVLVNRKKGSNKKGNSNIVSNGSVIHVYPNQIMLLMDGGKVIDYCAEEGYYTVNTSSTPSLFNGEIKESIKDTFNRFRFGGVPSQSQHVYYINLQEIKGIRFGTRNPIQYFDSFYNCELFMRCHGTYSIKITDPIKFFNEYCPRNAARLDINQINEQCLNEFLTALQAAINQMSVDGVRISMLTSKAMELAKYMSKCLDDEWNEKRGFEVSSVGIASLSYDEESQKLINMRNQGAMMSDPTIREGYVQSNIAEGLKAAGSNPGGAGQSFMAMGMGMNTAGGFMDAASRTNAQQMQVVARQAQMQQNNAAAKPSQGSWKCSCSQENTGNFCSSCGAKRPVTGSWKCSCGQENTGNFCSACGSKKPDASWQCACGNVNTGSFCSECGAKRP
ncbi:MAG: SPFH domain-containing protein [Oscillospiraceae bacterium]|nr:SPFH domain-containing protein [Oscillospiraceae bacterium]